MQQLLMLLLLFLLVLLLLLLTLRMLEWCKLEVALLHFGECIFGGLQKVLEERGIEGLIANIGAAEKVHRGQETVVSTGHTPQASMNMSPLVLLTITATADRTQ